MANVLRSKNRILKGLKNKEVDTPEYSDDELNLEDILELTDEQLNRMRPLTPLQKTLA